MSNSEQNRQTNFEAALTALSLDRSQGDPLHQQLTEALREMILDGTAMPNDRLPPSRVLADELMVSRATVVTALDQLASEGYLYGHRGAGTFVASDLPHLITPKSRAPIAEIQSNSAKVVPFHPGIPDLRLFPYRQWARHLEAAWRRPAPELLHHPDPFGWRPLRRAIADHLSAWRNVDCSAEQVVVTAGGSHAFTLIASFLGTQKPVMIESPIYPIMQNCFEQAGLSCQAIPVDENGLNPAHLPNNASAAVVTPSRQFPLGMTMPVPRRLALLDWAKNNKALIIEDDYDSEFRYQGQPVPALAGLDTEGLTIYMGSFSKLLSATLRLGYLVVPSQLVADFRDLTEASPMQPSLTPQPALATFMESGDFARHIRKTRRLYGKRHRRLHELLAEHLEGFLVPTYQSTGMHILCEIGPDARRFSDREIASLGEAAGLYLRPLSAYAQANPAIEGLVLGFAGFSEEELEEAVLKLSFAVRSSEKP